jgi:hypothetical protein
MLHRSCRSGSRGFLRGWSFTIILSSIILIVLKDLLANFVVTYTLKDKRIAWLGLVEGKLASLLD